jgi:hypothetical protein
VETRCHVCKKTPEELTLAKCPICLKYYCEIHSFDRGGVRFCSAGCAEYFFFGDPDDHDE